MLFKAPTTTPDGLAQMDVHGDKFKFTHVQNVEKVMAQAHQDRKDERQGWSKDRTMRRVASIPVIEWLRHPEWQQEIVAYGDSPSMRKWLCGEYGSLFKTVDNL